MATTKKYWKGLEELSDDPAIESLKHNEFAEQLPTAEFLGDKENLEESSTSRRDFLKFLGFSTAAATLAACEAPVIKSIPYVVKPEEIIPGIPNYYASTYADGHDYASVLVKTREGRPIKIEGNPEAGSGSVNARIQASALSLYDSTRLRTPLISGEEASWSAVDAKITDKLETVAASGKQVVVLTGTILSPSTKAVLADFGKKYTNLKHVTYDAVSYSGMLEANTASFGVNALPSYHFNKAEVVVSFGADFLGNWLDVDFASQYAELRNPKKKMMSRHIQFESNLSLTGSNADTRVMLKPSEQSAAIANLYNAIAKKLGRATVKAAAYSKEKSIDQAAKELLAAKGKSLVVTNSNDANVQLLVNAINNMLGNYGRTIDLSTPSYLKQGSDADLKALMADMKSGKVGALLLGSNTNPAYTLANAEAFVKLLSKVDLTVSFSLYNDETASHMQFVCPDNHFLESWGDAMPKAGHYSLQQPTIRPLFDTRQMQDSFLKWSGASQNYYDYLSSYWKSNILGASSWNKTLHDGVFVKNTTVDVASFAADVNAAANAVSKVKAGKFEIELYEKVSIGTGSLANNPWLQEMPDPITKNTWDNYLTVSKSTADALELTNWNVSNGALNGDRVNITVNGVTMNNVPVLIQPGQAKDTFGLALGYGRNVGKEQNIVGINAFPLMNGTSNASFDVKIEKAEGEHFFAATQLHHTMMGRAIVKEATLADYIKDSKAGNPDVLLQTHEGKKPVDKVTLWEDHEKGVHFWNLSIDLTSCIGCGNCVVSCQSENNVPVVGKEEVRKSRDMHWIRIDRYFSSDEEDKVKDDRSFDLMEDASENPEVVYMPVMCQHCNHAPCETVCPVAATTHSSEGLNHMAYNRCIGTRYCANNCPYKVRRFNWFNYSENDAFNFNMNDDLGKMVLNPDVVVRTRGVMEKCSMCIQRIQYGKLEAKKGRRKVVDGDIQTACSSVCPTNAIVFGDAQDRSSKVAELKEDERSYHLLEELDTQPSVFYQTKIRNKA